jgi:hypothetical protein
MLIAIPKTMLSMVSTDVYANYKRTKGLPTPTCIGEDLLFHEGRIYNNIDCQLAICGACTWSMVLFKPTEQYKNNTKHVAFLTTCPRCSSNNISLITIANGIGGD